MNKPLLDLNTVKYKDFKGMRITPLNLAHTISYRKFNLIFEDFFDIIKTNEYYSHQGGNEILEIRINKIGSDYNINVSILKNYKYVDINFTNTIDSHMKHSLLYKRCILSFLRNIVELNFSTHTIHHRYHRNSIIRRVLYMNENNVI